MKAFFRNNGLSLVLLALFLTFWVAQSTRPARGNHRRIPQRLGVLVPVVPELAERIPRGAFDRAFDRLAEHLPPASWLAGKQGGR